MEDRNISEIDQGVIEKDHLDDPADESSLLQESDLGGLFEAALFLSNEPLPVSFFVRNFSVDPTHAKIILSSLLDEYSERDGGILLLEVAKGYQFVSNSKYSKQLRQSLGMKSRDKLSKGMLETLSIIAYKQPIVLADIDELRGVSSRMMVANLMKRNLIKPMGRVNLPGRPLSYGTTDKFLEYFGLNRLSDLPKLSEIKEFSIDSE
jgi:segregation and condensation protein B